MPAAVVTDLAMLHMNVLLCKLTAETTDKASGVVASVLSMANGTSLAHHYRAIAFLDKLHADKADSD